MFKPEQVGKRTRYTYAKINEVLEMPHLLDVQRKSYEWFLASGLQDIFNDISPIKDNSGNLELSFTGFSLGEPKYDINESKNRDATYAAPLRVNVRLVNKDPENYDIKEQEVFMGDFPLMTPTGTFVINGAERVIVSQLVRSPGVYYGLEVDTMGMHLYNSTVIPNRGAWIELETDANEIISVRIDRNRKLPATILVRALGWETDEAILELFWNGKVDEYDNPVYDQRLLRTLEKDSTKSQAEALIEIYKKLRPGEPPTVDSARNLFDNLFFDSRRYDLARVGRYKLNKKLGWRQRLFGQTLAKPIVNTETGEIILDAETFVTEELLDVVEQSGVFGGEGFAEFFVYGSDGSEAVVTKVICNNSNLPFAHRTVTREDMIADVSYLLNLMDKVGQLDDIDHLGNRRLRCVGELLQNQFRIGLTRIERVVKERMTVQDTAVATPQGLLNIRPVVAAIKEFFGSSQLSQFMDQTNPLGELTHKRRLSALGPGGLSRERAGFEVRDVHNSHYGRMCPIETPEGPNIGLINSLSNYAKVNEFGFIEAPYRRVEKVVEVDENGKEITKVRVSNQVVYMTADEEEGMTIAQANSPIDDEGYFTVPNIACRRGHDVLEVAPEKVDYMDVSPKEVVSIGTAMIPFLENDDANRALMGANMQRQAVPLLRAQAPLVGTGMEYKAACDSGVCVLAKEAGTVIRCWGNEIHIKRENGRIDVYHLNKFLRSNQSTCFNQKPIVYRGDKVVKGQVLADGPATDGGELALGFNVLVAFMPWEGYNYEDAILLSEELCKEDIYTSIHIEEYECEARDTKLGAEEITRELPNTGDETLKNIDENGIICIGADVKPGDILVGKVTPKGETELTPEERLLRAIFGDKEREVRDTSLRVPHGESGKIVDVKIFTRENGDELSPGVNKLIRVYIAQKRKIHEGDKMAGRHGNKGVVSRVMRKEDMPFLPDGTPVQIVLNPLGVPSRMNIGQVLETHLGWAVQGLGMQIKATDLKIQEVLNTAKTDATYWLGIDGLQAKFAELDALEAQIAQNVTVSHLDVDAKISEQKEGILDEVRAAAQVVLDSLGGMARYEELKGEEKAIADAKIEHFGEEDWEIEELSEDKVAELAKIEEVVSTIRSIDETRHKRAEIRKDLEKYGYDYNKYGMPKPDKAGIHIATPVFDGAHEGDVFDTLRIAGRDDDGKTVLYDGRTGEPMDNRVTVGYVYMLKLHHLVDDKIHARSTGPYSLVTQQPLGGKAQFGGQRFGEMEVWALEAYGAAYTLQELLTVKSDDTIGRVKAYEKIVKGENIPEPGVPESFKVLLKELQSIGLDVKILNEDQEEVVIKELDDDDEPTSEHGESDVKEIMSEGEVVSTEEAPDGYIEVDEEEPVNAGEEDDILSNMSYVTEDHLD